MSGKPKTARACIDCAAMYEPSGVRQQRCIGCGAKHIQKKNVEYQAAFRARHRTKEDAERSERRAWRMDAQRGYFELLCAEGLTANAIARKTRHSRRTVAMHLARPEVQRRVGILRRLDMPELPH